VFDTSHGGNRIATCQDCHFRDIDGATAAKGGVVRPGGSTVHPLSGVPEHRMIGGNLWVPYILASTVSTSPNYSPAKEALLGQGPDVLTLDLSQGEALNPNLLLETVTRSGQMLQDSISMIHESYSLSNRIFTLRLQNHTGHKLISGYPEGRRMFLNIKAYVGNDVIYQINPYDYTVGTLKGLADDYSPNSPALRSGEEYRDEMVYEIHQGRSLLGVDQTLHMALATHRTKDNRILPQGFDITNAASRLCEPVWHRHSDTNVYSPGNFYTQAEYEGGYDEVTVSLPIGTERIAAGLYYQTTSREFVEFLRDEINGTGGTLTNSAYIAQTDPWFSGLKAWGDTLWQLWDNNKDVPGAAPVLMTNTFVSLDVSDTDGDGIPAYWETEHFGGPTNANPSIDNDFDGKSNLDEYITMTNPHDDHSLFEIEGVFSNGVPGLSFPAYYARSYTLSYTTNLVEGSWSNLLYEVPGTDEVMVLYETNTSPQAFFKVSIEKP
jgi:hypothetical protein